jgi:hypothetical protein
MKLTAGVLVAVLALPHTAAAAQQTPAPGASTHKPLEQGVNGTKEADEPVRPVDASKLGVSLDRIRRELRQAEIEEQQSDGPLNFRFTVEVYGTAPRIDLLEDFPLTGPVPYGGPTHREVVEFLTPQAYRMPVVPFSALGVWAAKALWNKSKKARCEAELEEYKKLVMQGVSVAAPTCSQ